MRRSHSGGYLRRFVGILTFASDICMVHIKWADQNS